MKTEIIHEGVNHKGQQFKVIAFYAPHGFLYTKTYIYDDEGYVDKQVTVYADGRINTQ